MQRYLTLIGLKQVDPRPIPTVREAPEPGEFCGESPLASRKADIVVALHDGRVMPIECKVSNSALNSVKRLNNDAAAKAAQWLDALGKDQVVPCALLSGVFKKRNLEHAQNRGADDLLGSQPQAARDLHSHHPRADPLVHRN